MISLEKFENESDMEYAIRILSAKVEHEIDLDWEELVSILNLPVGVSLPSTPVAHNIDLISLLSSYLKSSL